jgi:cell shape-determining protein MreD
VTNGASDPQAAGNFRSVFVVGLVLLAHFVFRPWLESTPFAPDLLIGGLLLAALRIRAGSAALLGFVLGGLEAAMALDNPGIYALVFTLVGYAAARSRDLLFADAHFYVVVYLFTLTFVARTALIVIGATGPGIGAAIAWSVVTAAVTSVVCSVADAAASPVIR